MAIGFRNLFYIAALMTGVAAADEPRHLQGYFIAGLIDEYLDAYPPTYGIESTDPLAGSLLVDASGNLIPAEQPTECTTPVSAVQRIDISVTRRPEIQGTTLRTEYVITSRLTQLPPDEITHEEELVIAVVEDAEGAEFLGVPDRFALEPIMPELIPPLLDLAGVTGFGDGCGAQIADYQPE